MRDEPLVASVEVRGQDDSDPEEVDELARSLQQELLAVGVDDAQPAMAGRPARGAKAGDALQLGAILVATSPVALQGVIEAVRHWAGMRPVRKVTITIADDTLSLEGATQSEQEDLVKAFLARHGDEGE